MDEEDTDPHKKQVRKVIDLYKNMPSQPPPIPKRLIKFFNILIEQEKFMFLFYILKILFRVDSIAKNIDQYFNIQLVKDAEKDEMVHKIEQEILDFSMDEEDISEKSNEQEFEIPPLPEELKKGLTFFIFNFLFIII